MILIVLLAAAPAFGQGACCFMDQSCQPAADEAECNGLGGVFLPGADCAEAPCGTGACCRETACVETDAFSCISAGRDFAGAGTLCADDPCAIGQGACCLKDGTCQEISPEDCTAMGGTFQGIGTVCAGGFCTLGGCCLPGGCQDLAQFECDAQGGRFFGGVPCVDEPCPANDCPKDTLFGQQRDEPDDFTAGTSETSAGFERFEDFSGVAGPIDGLVWFGLDLDHIGGNNFVECVEIDPTFTINFFDDAGGQPGDLVCSYKLVATRTPLGIFYLGAELNEYSVTLPAPCVLVSGWVSIVGLGDPECWFLWMSAGSGFSWCEGCSASAEGFDLAICLTGTPGGAFGACCDDASGTCTDNVEISDCTAPGLRFAPDTLCADLDPACGVFLGACCLAEATCTIQTQGDCTAAGGDWLGANTQCNQCPCAVPCPPQGTAEGEPDCFDGYVDTFNGGCPSSPAVFSPISLGETVCAFTGIYDNGASVDWDYYQITVAETTELIWTVEAEFEPRAWILDGTGGCPGLTLITDATFECNPLTISTTVGAGTYWLVVAPNTFTDTAACPAFYTASLGAPCPEDLDGDGNVGTTDLLALLAAWGPNAGHPADLDDDGNVGTTDLLGLLAAWGPCP